MPRIPKAQQRGISNEARGVSIDPNSFGGAGRAIQKIGGDVQAMALSFLEKRKLAQTNEFAATESRAYREESARLQTSLKDFVNEEGNIFGHKDIADNTPYSVAMRDWSDGFVANSQDIAPTIDASERYSQKIQNDVQMTNISSDLFENKLKTIFHQKFHSKQDDSMGRMLLDVGNLDNTVNEIRERHVEIDEDENIGISQSFKATAKQASHNMGTTKLLDKLLIDIKGSADKKKKKEIANHGINILRGKAFSNDEKKIIKESSFAEMTLDEAKVILGEDDEAVKQAIRQGATKVRIPIETKFNMSEMDVGKSAFLTDGLSPDEKREYLMRFLQQFKDGGAESMRDANSVFRDHVQKLEEGRSTPGEEDAVAFRAIDELTEINKGEGASEFNRDQKLFEMKTARDSNTILRRMHQSPPAFWRADLQAMQENFAVSRDEYVSKIPPGSAFKDQRQLSSFIQGVRSRQEANFGRISQAIIRERAADPALYSINHFDEMEQFSNGSFISDPRLFKKYSSLTTEIQSKIGIAKTQQRVLPKQMSKSLARDLMQMDDEQATARLSQLERVAGSKYYQVFADLTRDGELPHGYFVASFVRDPESKRSVISSLKPGRFDDMKKRFFEQFVDDEPGAILKEVRSEVEDRFGPIAKAITQSTSDGERVKFANALSRALVFEGMRIRMIEGNKSKDAGSKSFNNIVANNFVAVSGGNTDTLMPTTFIDDFGNRVASRPSVVGSFLKSMSRVENLSKLNLELPDVFVERQKGLTNKVVSEFVPHAISGVSVRTKKTLTSAKGREKQRFMLQLKRNAVWSPNAAQDGYVLMMREKDGEKLIPIRSQDPVTGESSHVEVKIKDMIKTDKPWGKAVLDETKPFFDLR